MAGKILEVLGADGVLTNVDIVGALEHGTPPELRQYFVRAAQFVHQHTGLELQMTFDGIKDAILQDIFINRGQPANWHEFGQGVKIAPAVDHMLITPFAVRAFLKDVIGSLASDNPLRCKITDFLTAQGGTWEQEMYKFATERFWDSAQMDEDAIEALDYALIQENPVAIATNSSALKIEKLLKRAGRFPADRVIHNKVEAGKIGVFDDVKKYKINTLELAGPGSLMNLKSMGVPVTLDLRRTHYRRKLLEMMAEADVEMMNVTDSIAEFLAPVPYLFGEEQIDETVFLNLRRTPNTTASQLVLARNIKAKVSDKLTRLTDA